MGSHRADAAIAWSAMAEPGDEPAEWLVGAVGHAAALSWVEVAADDAVAATMALAPHADQRTIDAVVKASERWVRRRRDLDVDRVREQVDACGARVIVCGEPEWPAVVDDWGPRAPHAIYARGEGHVGRLWSRAIGVVGARAATSYGEHVAGTFAADLADRAWTVVSGGAYGIDAAAHRGALAAGGASLAVMAGGVDRLYPVGNTDLLQRTLESGAVVSEAPPGWAPHRSRFLSRNRLIACAGATVVVEAAGRSGALSTAAHAARLLRPVGAVPGPITSAASAGCHQLLKDAVATVVVCAQDAIDLAGPLDVAAVEEGTGSEGAAPDFARPADRAAFDALGARTRDGEHVARVAGLTLAEAAGALGRLEMSGLARRDGPGWRRVTDASQAPTRSR